MIKKFYLLFFIFFIAFILIINISLTISHEKAHNQINKIYNCKSSKIKYSNLYLTGKTISNCSNLDQLTQNKINYLHTYNEIISYNLKILINAIIISSFIIVFAIFSNSKS